MGWFFLLCPFSVFAHPADTLQADTTQVKVANWIIDNLSEELPQNLIQPDSAETRKNIQHHIATNFATEGYFNASLDSFQYRGEELDVYTTRGCRFSVSEISLEPDTVSVDVMSFFSEGDGYSDAALEQHIRQKMDAFEQQGYPLVTIEVTEIKPDPDNCEVAIFLKVKYGEQIYVHDLEFNGIERTDAEYLKIASGLRDSVMVTPAHLRHIRRNLENTNYFRHVSQPDIIRRPEGHALLFHVEETNLNRFDAILGYVPQPDNSNIIVGTADLRVRNVGWQGSTLSIMFERLQLLTTKFDVGYEREWVRGWPLGLGGSFDFIQQDTTYQIRNIRARGRYYLTSNSSVVLGVRREGTSANQNPEVPILVLDGTANFAGIGFDFDNTDRRISPQRGIRSSVFLETGFKNTSDVRADEYGVERSMSQQEIAIDLRHYFTPYRRQVVASRINAYFMESPQYTESDMTRFGGARSFRGYREDQFRASRLLWGDVEYRYLLDPYSYAFVFGAYGGYRRPALITEDESIRDVNRTIYSWGIGFTYNTPVGFMQFTYALSDEDDLANGKIHFGIISEF